MSADRHLAEIYARQTVRVGYAAVVVAAAGALGTIVAAVLVGMPTSPASEWHVGPLIVTLCEGAVITAVLYAVLCALHTHAETASVRHLAAARATERPTTD